MQMAGTQVVFFLQSSDSCFQTDVGRFGFYNHLKGYQELVNGQFPTRNFFPDEKLL